MIIKEGIALKDRKDIEDIVRSSEYFYEFEIKTALELADISIELGTEKSGYHWLKAIDDNGKVIGFTNYGRNEFSVHSWELYWIAVHENARNKKAGSVLLKKAEENIIKAGGKILWIETSGRPLYQSTEEFYKRNGYILQASLEDFYGPGDPKQIYAKRLM